MNQLTKEEVARVFAMYMTTLCQRVYTNTSLSSGEDDTIKCSHDILKIILSDTIRTWSYKLLLTPLSKITDEHAVEVARLLYEDKKEFETFDLLTDSNAISVFKKQLVEFFGNLKNELGYEAYLYLIHNNYAVPLFFGINHWANGKTAIELGIAIDKTINQ